MTPIVCFSGPSGVGKTRLLVRLIPALVRLGLRVGALKHSGHPHPFDRRGKDSDRLRRAGARAVAIQGPAGLAYFGPPVPGARALARLLPPVDLVVAEGFKRESLPRVEVHRRDVSSEFLCARDPRVIAVVTDEPPPRELPQFGPAEVEALAEFLCVRLAAFASPSAARPGAGARSGARALAGPAAREHRFGKKASARSARETHPMPKTKKRSTTSRGSRSRRGGGGSRSRSTGRTSRSRTSRGRGTATVREAGRKGGERTLRTRGASFYSEIGRKGGRIGGPRGGKKGGQRVKQLVEAGKRSESRSESRS